MAPSSVRYGSCYRIQIHLIKFVVNSSWRPMTGSSLYIYKLTLTGGREMHMLALQLQKLSPLLPRAPSLSFAIGTNFRAVLHNRLCSFAIFICLHFSSVVLTDPMSQPNRKSGKLFSVTVRADLLLPTSLKCLTKFHGFIFVPKASISGLEHEYQFDP